MGQKVNPHGLRVGLIKDWDSHWYDEDVYENHDLIISNSVIGVVRPWEIPKRAILSRCIGLWQLFKISIYSIMRMFFT